MISINWFTKVITIPQSFLTPLGGSFYELNLNDFRLALKDLEDDDAGMPWPLTHNHNTETVLSGITFARSVEITNGYQVIFEDGQYGVNLVGANSNIPDVLIRNQVSVNSQNSAGLIVTAGGGGSSDWTTTERNQIRGALGITGTQATPAGGGQLQDIRTPIVANLNATVSSRSVAGDAMTLTTPTKDAIADKVWDESATDHVSAGSMGQLEGQLDAAVSSRATPADVNALVGQGLTDVQATMLLEIYRLYGLDPLKPLVVTAISRKVPASGVDISQTIFESPDGSVTISRQ